MAKLKYPISFNYRNWGPWEALRDLIQNTLDAGDAGDKIKVWRSANGTINLVNEGTALTRGDLVLGESSKRGSKMRGRKGEGMKIACLALVKMGCAVKIRTGEEIWIPRAEDLPEFGGKTCLVIETKAATPFPGVKIEIDGFSREAFDQAMSLIIDNRIPGAAKPAKIVKTTSGSVIVDPNFAGKLFVGGLFVADLSRAVDQPFVYGFNYDPDRLELDSDRKLADPWVLRYAIGSAMEDAMKAVPIEQAYDTLRVESFESEQLAKSLESGSGLVSNLMFEHQRRFGADSIPVASEDQAVQAANVGIKVHVAGKGLAAIASLLQPFDDRINNANQGPKRTYDRSELTNDEIDMIAYLDALVVKIGLTYPISIVDFWSPGIAGQCSLTTKRIALARRILNDRAECVATLVHEIAHGESQARDGTAEHIRSMESLFARLIVALGVEA